jgi:16S rRNA (uracil1498-N3)-methyltransferase
MNEARRKEARTIHSSGRVPRLFVDGELAAGVSVDLLAPAAHYLRTVLRLSDGAEVLAFDDRTGEWRARLVGDRRRPQLMVEARTRMRERVPDLWLCAAPLKKGRIDWLAEKACELGARRLVLTATRRSVVEKPNLGRLRAHMVEAAEQCGRTALPELQGPVPLAALLADWPAERALVFCDEAGGEPAAGAMARAAAPAAILIGPEGGFSADERAAIRALPQVLPVALGPRVLRADTAAVAAVTLWMAARGDW